MSPSFLSAAVLAHIIPARKRSSFEPDSELDHGDPEKGDSSGSREDQGRSFDNDGTDHDQDDGDLDDLDEQADMDSPVGEENERRSVPLTSNVTISSSILRHRLPNWLVKTKETLFGSHHDHDHDVYLPNYRRAPIISGSLIPFSILLEIPGLTEHWDVRTYGNQIVETRENPPLVVV